MPGHACHQILETISKIRWAILPYPACSSGLIMFDRPSEWFCTGAPFWIWWCCKDDSSSLAVSTRWNCLLCMCNKRALPQTWENVMDTGKISIWVFSHMFLLFVVIKCFSEKELVVLSLWWLRYNILCPVVSAVTVAGWCRHWRRKTRSNYTGDWEISRDHEGKDHILHSRQGCRLCGALKYCNIVNQLEIILCGCVDSTWRFDLQLTTFRLST